MAIWGTGSRGHIGLSVGNGTQAYETPSGEGRRVGYSAFGRNRWGEYFTWPGIDHSGPQKVTPGGGDELDAKELQDALGWALAKYHGQFVDEGVGEKRLDGKHFTLRDRLKFDVAEPLREAIKALPVGPGGTLSKADVVAAVESALTGLRLRK